MTYLRALAASIAIVLFSSCGAHKPTAQSTKSFNKEFGSVTWGNSVEIDKIKKTPCTANFLKIAKANKPKSLTLKKNSFKELIEKLFHLDKEINKLIKDFDLETRLAEDNGFFKIGARDKFYNSFDPFGNFDKFKAKLKKRNDGKPIEWYNKEKSFDEALKRFHDKTKALYITISRSEKFKKGTCSFERNQFISILEVTQTKITFEAFSRLRMTCDCKGTDTTIPEQGSVMFTQKVIANFPNDKFDLNALIFKNTKKAEHKILLLYCCWED